MAIFGVTIYKTPVSFLARQNLSHIQVMADQNFNKKRNMSVARMILSFADSCLTEQTEVSEEKFMVRLGF